MSIFTSTPSPVNNITSSVFIDNGNPGETPAKISEVNIYSIPVPTNRSYALFKEYFHVHVAAAIKEQTIVCPVGTQPYLTIANEPKGSIFPLPPVGIAMPGMANESTVARMSSLGFIKESVGRAPFFRGSVTDESIVPISNMHPNIDTAVPFGITNLRGWLAYRLTERLLLGAFKAIPGSVHKNAEGALRVRSYKAEYANGSYTVQPSEWAAQTSTDAVCITPNKFQDFKAAGYLFPYFQTLLLPDRLYVPNFISRTLYPLLADKSFSPTSASSTMASLRQGWKTLASTQSGLYLQHMTFCLDLALQSGSRPLVLMKEDGSYLGCLLSTPIATFQKNNRVITGIPKADMPKALQGLSQHETGIDELCAQLNQIPAERRNWLKTVTITKHHLSTPRQIHNLVRRFSFSNAERAEILQSLKKLSFANEYWSPRDLINIERVAAAISHDRYLDDTIPMPYNVDYIFSNDICISSLGAFGRKAPTPSYKNGEIVVIPHGSKVKEMFQLKLPSGKTLKKVGLYMESLTDAANTWREMKTNGTMRILQKKGDLVGAHWSFIKESPSANQLAQIVTTHFGKTPKEKKEIKASAEKRKRTDKDDAVRSAKKSRANRSTEMDSLLYGLGLSRPDDGDADESGAESEMAIDES